MSSNPQWLSRGWDHPRYGCVWRRGAWEGRGLLWEGARGWGWGIGVPSRLDKGDGGSLLTGADALDRQHRKAEVIISPCHPLPFCPPSCLVVAVEALKWVRMSATLVNGAWMRQDTNVVKYANEYIHHK